MAVFVCSLSPPRSFDGSSPNLVGVCRLTSHLPLRGSFSKRSTGQRVTFTFHYIIYAPASRHTVEKAPFALLKPAAESNSAPFAARHLNGVCRWTSQLRLRGSFSKRSTGRWVNGSNGSMGHISMVYVGGPRNCPWGVLFRKGQRVDGSTAHFHFRYIIYDSRQRQAHATLLQKAHSVWWHQPHATPLQKAHGVFCSLDG